MAINDESEDEATEDAKIFIEHARLFKPDFDANKPSIIFEEFLFGIIKIKIKHGLKIVDQLIDKYKEVYETGKILENS